MKRLSNIAIATFAAGSLLTSTPAWAHAKLVSSTPAADAVVTSPRSITLRFDETVVPAFSSFELTMPGHNNMKVPVRTRVSDDRKTITGTPQQRLSAGSYKIKWTIAGADGHRIRGEVPFRVR